MKVVIIEDEKPAARKLERLISNFTDLQLVATLNSVEEAIDWFSKNEHPMLIFSDIVLGDGLSFDIFEKPIVIGNSCWIATDVFVAPGVQIVDEVIVGARSSVFKSIVAKGIYKGNPVAKKEV